MVNPVEKRITPPEDNKDIVQEGYSNGFKNYVFGIVNVGSSLKGKLNNPKKVNEKNIKDPEKVVLDNYVPDPLKIKNTVSSFHLNPIENYSSVINVD